MVDRTVPADPTVSRPVALVASLVAVSVGVVAWAHRAAINVALTGVRDADRHWLFVASLAVVGLWICGSITQIGSLRKTPPIGRLFLVQVAASFMNNLLPAGVGGMAVNLRFLRRCGVGTRAGVAAVGLNSFAGLVAHVVLLLAVIVSLPGRFHMIWQNLSGQVHDALHQVIPGKGHVALATGGVVMAAALLVRERRRRAAKRATVGELVVERRTIRNELADLREVMRNPRRATALWLGALATPLLHGLVIYAALRSLDVNLSPVTAIAVYVTVSGLAALVPAPGGLGTFDVLLTGGLVAVGAPGAGAVGAVVAYRLLTVWLPLVPAGCVFAVLMRRAII